MLNKLFKQKIIWPVLVALALLIAACTPDSGPSGAVPTERPEDPTTTPAPTEPSVLENLDVLLTTEWNLVTMAGAAPLDGAMATISFTEEGTLNGTTGCNSYFGDYTLDGTSLTVGQLGQTEMWCEGRMEQEQTFLMMLMSGGTLTLENDTLTIYTGSGDLVFQPAEHQQLEGTTWTLSGIAQGDAIVNTWVDERITAEFNDGQVGGSSGCNSYGGSYQVEGSSLTISEVVGTLMACAEDEINQREAEFLSALPNVASYEIVRDTLTLFDADGNVVLTFQGAENTGLAGTSWILSSIAQGDTLTSLRPEQRITAEFLDGRLSGFGGCNTYGADYQAEGNTLTLGEINRTLMDCTNEEFVQLETTYLEILSTITSYEMTADSLTLFDAEGKVVLTFQAATVE
jgi:heat shock protein HslJ